MTIRASPAASGAISAFQGYGRLLVKADGSYSFRTLKPVAYPGRAPHIHFKVATASGGLLTSQFYIAGEPGNERDGVFRAAVRDPRQRERIEMRLSPAPGVEAASPPRWTSSSARGGRLSGPLDGLASAGYLLLEEDDPWRAGNRQSPQTRAAWRSDAT